MGMLVDVFRRRDRDCSNGGVSGTNDTLLVVDSDAAAPANPTVPVMVVEQYARGAVCLRTIKIMWDKNKIGPMAGGNFAAGESKFNEAVAHILGINIFNGAVPIHDRFESQELADQLGHDQSTTEL